MFLRLETYFFDCHIFYIINLKIRPNLKSSFRALYNFSYLIFFVNDTLKFWGILPCNKQQNKMLRYVGKAMIDLLQFYLWKHFDFTLLFQSLTWNGIFLNGIFFWKSLQKVKIHLIYHSNWEFWQTLKIHCLLHQASWMQN